MIPASGSTNRLTLIPADLSLLTTGVSLPPEPAVTSQDRPRWSLPRVFFRHQGALLRSGFDRDFDNLVIEGHFQVERGLDRAAQHLEVAVLDMAPVFAQVDRDLISAAQFRPARRRLPGSGSTARRAWRTVATMVNIDTQSDQGGFPPVNCFSYGVSFTSLQGQRPGHPDPQQLAAVLHPVLQHAAQTVECGGQPALLGVQLYRELPFAGLDQADPARDAAVLAPFRRSHG